MIDSFWLQGMMGGNGVTDTHKDAAQRGPAGVHRGLRGIRKSQQRKC
jgi:hypothetical protein